MYEEMGRCPYCDSRMESTMGVSWRGKYLGFAYPVYLCYRHGYFIWRGSRRGHVLADFSKLEKEAIEVKVEPPEAKPNAYAEAPIIEIKCKYCGYRWKQYLTPFVKLDKGVWCPDCRSFLDLNKDILVNR